MTSFPGMEWLLFALVSCVLLATFDDVMRFLRWCARKVRR